MILFLAVPDLIALCVTVPSGVDVSCISIEPFSTQAFLNVKRQPPRGFDAAPASLKRKLPRGPGPGVRPHPAARRDKTAVPGPAPFRTVPWRAPDPVGSALAVQALEKSLTTSTQKR